MTLKLEGDLNILKMHLHTENEVARLRHSKFLQLDEICTAITNEMNKYENNSEGQRSNVINFQTLIAFTVGHIPAKLYQFLISSYRDLVREVWTDRHTHTQTQPKTIPARSIAGVQAKT